MAFLAVAVATALVYAVWVAVGAAAAGQPLHPAARPGQDHRLHLGRRRCLYLLLVAGLYVLYAHRLSSRRPRQGQSGGRSLAFGDGVLRRAALGLPGHGCRRLRLRGPRPNCWPCIASTRSSCRRTRSRRRHRALPGVSQRAVAVRTGLGPAGRRRGRCWRATTCWPKSCCTKAWPRWPISPARGLVFTSPAAWAPTPPRARASAYLYLWNPMLLWEMVGNAHNDGLMMLLGLLARVAVRRRRADLLVLPALVARRAGQGARGARSAPVLFIGLWHRNRAQGDRGRPAGAGAGGRGLPARSGRAWTR